MNIFSAIKNILISYGAMAIIGAPIIVMFRPIDLYGFRPVTNFLLVAIFIAVFLTYPLLAIGKKIVAQADDDFQAGHKKKFPNYILVIKRLLSSWSGIIVLILIIGLAAAAGGVFGEYIINIPINLFVYGTIAYSLSRFTFFTLIIISVIIGLIFSSVISAKNRKMVAGLASAWLMLCFFLSFFYWFKSPPNSEHCREYYGRPGITELLSRQQIDLIDRQVDSLPYDLISSENAEYLFISLKRTDFKPGALVMLDRRRKQVINMLSVAEDVGDYMEFPEQLDIDRSSKKLFALVYSPDRYRVMVVDYSTGRMIKERTLALPGEPHGIHINKKKNNFIVTLTDKYDYRAIVFDLNSFEVIARPKRSGHSDAIGDMVFSADGEKVYMSNFGPGDKVFVAGAEDYEIERSVYFFWPLIGVELNPKTGLLYAAAPLIYSIFEIGADDLKIRRSFAADGGIAHLEIDPKRGLLYSAEYAGTLEAFDLSGGEKRATIELGRLLRNLDFNPGAGTLTAASGCGVFDIDIEGF